MKIDVAKEDLWWIRCALEESVRSMEGCPNPAAFSKAPAAARKHYKKLTAAWKKAYGQEPYIHAGMREG